MADPLSCRRCGKIQSILKRCTRCQDAVYCTRDCQVKDWVTHKLICNHKSKNATRVETISITTTPNKSSCSEINSGISAQSYNTQHGIRVNGQSSVPVNISHNSSIHGANSSNQDNDRFSMGNGHLQHRGGHSNLRGEHKMDTDTRNVAPIRLESEKQSTDSVYVSAHTGRQVYETETYCDKTRNDSKEGLKSRNFTRTLAVDFDSAAKKLSTVSDNDEVLTKSGDISGGKTSDELLKKSDIISGRMASDFDSKVNQKAPCHISSSSAASGLPVIDSNHPVVTFTVKGNRDKHKVVIQEHWTGDEVMKLVSQTVQIPIAKLKLICKGKIMTKDNVKDFAKDKAIFQALGEKAENDDGLDKQDIEVIMKQINTDRNTAIKALRKNGSVIDAIIDIGDK